jgi:ligand-binding SRPBCC domain-containing protein
LKTYTLERAQYVSRPLSEVFSFFGKPENLELLIPDSLDFRIVSPKPIEMKQGATIDCTLRLFGFRFDWTSFISEYVPPNRFVDVQVKGPYSRWEHTHMFSEMDDGTLIEDVVEYSLPYGLLGRWAHYAFVKKSLESIFDYRKLVIERLFPERVSDPSVEE